MPVLKAFLFEPGGADAYLDLDVRIVRGKDPELVMGERRLSLSGYTTPEALHGLLAEHSFTRADDGLRNHHWQCYHWRDKGECAATPVHAGALRAGVLTPPRLTRKVRGVGECRGVRPQRRLHAR